jgi:hypothetical protein
MGFLLVVMLSMVCPDAFGHVVNGCGDVFFKPSLSKCFNKKGFSN